MSKILASRSPSTIPSGKLFEAFYHVLALLFFVYAFFLSLRPLSDPDLWWNLRQGQWILENMELPGKTDPFNYTTPPLIQSELTGLRNQWLGQVVFYLVFSIGGYPGLSAFRAFLVVAPFVYFYLRFSRAGVNPLILVASLSFPLLIIGTSLFNTFERPQAFSFLLALTVFLLLYRIRNSRSVHGMWLLPAVMILWANLHGGYIVGVAIIGLFMAGESARLLVLRSGLSTALRFLIICALGIAATGLKPGAYGILGWFRSFPVQIAAPSAEAAGTVAGEMLEYKPLWYFYTEMHLRWPFYITAFMAATLTAMLLKYISNRKFDLSETLVFASVAFLELYMARGVGFALLLFPLFMGNSLSVLKGARRLTPAIFTALISVSMLFYVHGMAPGELSPGPPARWVNAMYPDGAIDFLKEHHVKGPMFNHLRWGGYLIWKAPEYKVFADGRSVDSDTTALYISAIGGSPQWSGILDSFNVNFVLSPVLTNGSITPLIMRIVEEKPGDWRLVYLLDNAAVYVRNRPENSEVIDCCLIPASELYFEIIALSEQFLSMMPGHHEALFSKAWGFYGLKEHSASRRILHELPRTPASRALLERIGSPADRESESKRKTHP